MKVIFQIAICLACLFTSLYAQPFSEVQKVVSTDRVIHGNFGYSVDIAGDRAIVGAKEEYSDEQGNNPITEAGAAYIYEIDSLGVWVLVQKIVASDRWEGDQFGTSVAIWGDFALIGAPKEDEDANGQNPLTHAGSAYLFQRDVNGVWNEILKITAPQADRGTDFNFGVKVAMDRDFFLISSAEDSWDTGGTTLVEKTGAVYIYERSTANNWFLTQKVVANDRRVGDRFGSSLDVDGSRVVVGCHFQDYDENGGGIVNGAGAAYVFEREGNGIWLQVQKLVAPDRDVSDYFGFSCSIYGSTIAIGAIQEQEDETGGNALFTAGAAYIYDRDFNGNWALEQKIVAGDRVGSQLFGYQVSLYNDYLLVGASVDGDSISPQVDFRDAGAAYFFTRDNGGVWNQEQKLVSSDRHWGDQFSFGTALSGNRAILGAPFESEDASGGNFAWKAGSAYFFEAPSLITSEPEPNVLEGIRVFPNPTQGEVHILTGDIHESIEVKVWNINGALMATDRFGAGQEGVLTIEGAAGIYFIQVVNEAGESVRKKVLKL